MKRCLCTVAIGEKYIKMSENMIQSFLAHNPDWDVRRYYDDEVISLVPESLRWNAFTVCEIGRWLAMDDCIKDYEQVFYCDNDMRWYGQYQPLPNGLVLSPHYIGTRAKKIGKHLIQLCGYCNLGMVTMNKCDENKEVIDYVVGETFGRPEKFCRTHCGERVLWLQNMVSCLPDCGVDVVYDQNYGLNVAHWNLSKSDREVVKDDGKYMVKSYEGDVFPLVSFHFSASSLMKLDWQGDAVVELKSDYLKEGLA